ncbi:LysR family substrate-binding domain-containing protein [Archangium violaceum]|uniref:LysR family substrate-binding domain-containing protein n=1 Tax=Archangium violaceum TaxID=83451 RepID=UPI000B1626D0|nr:LysR family substrate-binding domain-containing protein [Archangium violaceum]
MHHLERPLEVPRQGEVGPGLVASGVLARETEIGLVDDRFLRVGFAASSAFGVLPRIVLRFRSRFPEVSLELDDRERLDHGAALLAGELDLAIVRAPFRHEGVTVERLLRERFVLALPVRHPRAREKVVALSSLANEPFILFPRHSAPGLHDTITSMCIGAGFSPRIHQEAGSWPSVIGMVEAGLGLTIAPLSARALRPKGVVFRALRGAPGWAELAVIFPGQRLSPAAAHFRAIAHEMTRSHAGKDYTGSVRIPMNSS